MSGLSLTFVKLTPSSEVLLFHAVRVGRVQPNDSQADDICLVYASMETDDWVFWGDCQYLLFKAGVVWTVELAFFTLVLT